MPVIAAAIIGGAVVGAGANYIGSQEANSARKAEALKARNWEEDMSSTAHQREVADLRAAGLNPILSADSSGATWHSVAAPEIETPRTGVDLGASVSTALSAGRQNAMMDAQKALIDKQTTKTDWEGVKAQEDARIAKMDADAKQAEMSWLYSDHPDPDVKYPDRAYSAKQQALYEGKYAADIAKYTGQTVELQQARQKLRQMLQDYSVGQSAEVKAAIEEKINSSSYGQVLAWIDRISKSVQGVGSSSHSLKPWR